MPELTESHRQSLTLRNSVTEELTTNIRSGLEFELYLEGEEQPYEIGKLEFHQHWVFKDQHTKIVFRPQQVVRIYRNEENLMTNRVSVVIRREKDYLTDVANKFEELTINIADLTEKRTRRRVKIAKKIKEVVNQHGDELCPQEIVTSATQELYSEIIKYNEELKLLTEESKDLENELLTF